MGETMDIITLYIVDDYLLSLITHKNFFIDDKDFEIKGAFKHIKDCLKAMEKYATNVVLVDIKSIKTQDIELIKLIAKKYPHTKIIILTTYQNQYNVLISLTSGVSGYVLKNNKNELKNIIKNVNNGIFYMDLEIAKTVFSKIKIPNSKNITIPKEMNNVKNILTKRETEVLKLLVDGKTNSQIASEIVISTNTAKAHVGKILSKLSVKDRVQAVAKAIKENIVEE